MRILRLLSSIVLGILVLTSTEGFAKDSPKYHHGVIIPFDGEIGPALQSYFYRKLDAAHDLGADLVIVEIDSPGGRLYESLDIAERLQNVDWAHTVAYVPKWAVSGAAIVSLGCDDIVMAPGANIGDAGAIILDEKSRFRFVPQKAISILASKMRSIAKAKGRPEALAAAMVDKDLKVFHVKDLQSGETTYISESDYKAAERGKWHKLGEVATSGNDRFLALTGSQAADVDLAALVSDRRELAKRYGLKESDLQVLGPTGVDMAVDFLNNWLITCLLVIVGLTGLYMEAMAPGHGVGGLLAAACFLLLFWSHYLGGTAGWLQVVLFFLGLACIAVELFLLPGTVVPGLVGASMILVSLVMVIQGFLIPETTQELHTLASTMAMVAISCSIFVVAAVVITKRMDSLPLLNRLTLAPPDPDTARQTDANAAGDSRLAVGDLGVAHTPLRPGGKGRFGERTTDVQTSGDFLDRGTPIRVVRVSGNQVFVETPEES